MASEHGYFYTFHRADSVIIAKIVEDWGSKSDPVSINGNETTTLFRGTRLFGWACYNLLTNVDFTKEESSESSDITENLIRALSPAKIIQFQDVVEKNQQKTHSVIKLNNFPDAEEFQIAA